MKIAFEDTGTVEGLRRSLDQLADDPAVEAVFLLAADGNEFEAEQLDPVLKACRLPVFGGVFPGIIHDRKQHERGTIVAALTTKPDIAVLADLSNESSDYEQALDDLQFPDREDSTMIVLVDGFARRISSLLEALFNVFGLEQNYIGGGAGSLTRQHLPCLLTNDGMTRDAAILARLPVRSGIGVNHGWQTVDGPFLVTKSDQNVIHELECQPALDLYREVVRRSGSAQIHEHNLFDVAKQFPFGIQRYDAEMVVRDPISLTGETGLVCVGEVPQNSAVFVLTGTPDQLIDAASQALAQARSAFAPRTDIEPTTVFFDCISRVLFLGDEFDREIAAGLHDSSSHFGALTIGEIATSGSEFLEFYNKTSVVGVIEA